MFVYGMNLLSSSLGAAAGEKMEAMLKRLTEGRLKGTLLGTLITCLIQSSAAAVLIVAGFINAGIINLSQGIPVLFGSNIGSTITSHILRLGDISSDMIFLTLIKPVSFAPLALGTGAFMLLFMRNSRRKNTAKIFIGFGLLFLGMSAMEQTMSAVLESNPRFEEFFIRFTNPFICFLIGTALTGVLQSAAASIGILQALSSTGIVSFATAFPIILGANTGKCVPVWIGCIGGGKKTFRAAIIHTAFNVIGVIITGSVFLSVRYALPELPVWQYTVSRGDIANIHTAFNVVTAIILLPFSEKLNKLSCRLTRDDDSPDMEYILNALDDELLTKPSSALYKCNIVFKNMGQAILESYELAWDLLHEYDAHRITRLNENEDFLDKAYSKLNNYLVRIAGQKISARESEMLTEMLYLTFDFEQIGDYCVKIAKAADYNDSNNVQFSDSGVRELEIITGASRHMLKLTMSGWENGDEAAIGRVEPLRYVIHTLTTVMTERHVIRLQDGRCTVRGGASFLEILNDLDRIADHCLNIAFQVGKRLSGRSGTAAHFPHKYIDEEVSEEYKDIFNYYENEYRAPIEEMDIF